VRVVVLVPRRSDGGWRDTVWAWVKARWEREFPDWPVVEGHDSGSGLFSRCEALNRAAEEAGEWDVAVIADGDSITSPIQSAAAVGWAASTGRLAYAFDEFLYLSCQMTGDILNGYGGSWEPGVEWSLANTQSSQLAVPRALWDQVRGFDPGFDGWGYEDVAFASACETLGGVAVRVPGPVWHLWHPPSTDPTHARLANLDRLNLYLEVHGDRKRMADLIGRLRS
jgi:hypothetical protein